MTYDIWHLFLYNTSMQVQEERDVDVVDKWTEVRQKGRNIHILLTPN